MDLIVSPHHLAGTIHAIPSKSHAHRLLICAAFSDKRTTIICPETNRDMEATVQCLNAIGANIVRTSTGYNIDPVTSANDDIVLHCGESGSTLRFLLPVVGALGISARFKLSGRLPLRPLSPLWELMEEHGCKLDRPEPNEVRCRGKLHGNTYRIDGSVSSQFISGLLFAMAILPEDTAIEITGKIESKSYIHMTCEALRKFGIYMQNNQIFAYDHLTSPGFLTVEGDWSNAAFFMGANALGSNVTLKGLDPFSAQGDKAIVNQIDQLETFCIIDAADTPDLVPILSVIAAAKNGAEIINIRRLRLKESDRVTAITQMLERIGGSVIVTDNSMTVQPSKLHGGCVDTFSDHRIAMAAAIAATVSSGPITILDAHCVQKSYPTFWEHYRQLGGKYEQYLR